MSLSHRSFPSRLGSLARLALLLPVAAPPLAAQGAQWIRQLGTSGTEDFGGAAPAPLGGVFVVGATRGSLGGPNAGSDDVVLVRYDTTGGHVWTRQLGTSAGEVASAAAPDGAGGVFAVGTAHGAFAGPHAGQADAWVGRFDGAGSALWLRQLGTGANDRAFGAAADGAGGVYVCGTTLGSLGGPSAGDYDAWVARYDAAGSQLWVRQLGGAGLESASAAASGGAGGVIVGGLTASSLGGPFAGIVDAFVARYDAAGGLSWVRQLGTNANDQVLAAASDGAGGAFVAGVTHGNLGGAHAGLGDAWLARYDGGGVALWIRQLGTPQRDDAAALAADGAGGAYVAGKTGGALGGPTSGPDDAWLARYDSAGSSLWIDQLGTAASDLASFAASDGAGGAFVGGLTAGALGGPHAGLDDLWVARWAAGCGAVAAYCVASATSLPGCMASIHGAGAPSLGNPSGFTIHSGSVPGGILGICIFTDKGAASVPLGTLGGQLCVAAPFFRSKAASAGGGAGSCSGQLVVSLQDLIAASPIVQAGATIHAQFWARDPDNADGFLLSNGLSLSVCP